MERNDLKKIKLVLAEDHTIVRQGLRSLLDHTEEFEIVGEAENGRQAVSLVEKLRPDVVLMDVSMPVLNGIEATRRIKKNFPEVKVLVLTMHDNEEYIFQILHAGASGYLLKKSAHRDLFDGIRAVSSGGSFLSPSISKKLVEDYVRRTRSEADLGEIQKLTPREREVLQLIAEGQSNREIAEDLYLSVKTVETHKAHLMDKLDLHNTADLTKYAIRRGIIRPE